MEIPIENLKAKMRGVELNNYQKGLALDEFEKLIAHTEALEQQLRQYNVVWRSEQFSCPLPDARCDRHKIDDEEGRWEFCNTCKMEWAR